MSYELKDLLKGLDDSIVSQVEQTVKSNAKELDAKLFIDGDGEHYVPHARFDEVVNQRDAANASVTEQKAQLDKLAKQVEEGSDAQATIADLQGKLQKQSELAKNAILASELQPLISDSIAPASDILGFMDVSKITVDENGKVTGLKEQLEGVREAKKYLFTATDGNGSDEGQPGNEGSGKAGTGNPGNSGRVGSGPKPPKEIGSFGKQLAEAQAAQQAGANEAQSFFK